MIVGARAVEPTRGTRPNSNPSDAFHDSNVVQAKDSRKMFSHAQGQLDRLGRKRSKYPARLVSPP
jgi:hypothetical protein